MAKKALTLAELQALAASNENQTEVTSGVFERELPPEGGTVGRLIEYIELGKQKQRDYMGKPKPDNDDVRLTFEFLAPFNKHEYKDAEGNDRVRYDRLSFTIAKKLNEKAKYYKLFNQMRYGRDNITHMAQMLNDPLRLTVFHNTSKGKDGKDKTYANLWSSDGSMDIGAPVLSDPLTRKVQKLAVPAAFSPLRIFLWSNPTPETWDSLFVDGEWETKDKDGNVTETRSKNWLQETILGASDFTGSKLDAMLGGLTEEETPLEEVEDESEEAEAEEAEQEVEEEIAPPRPVKAAAKSAKPVVPAKAAAKPVGKVAAKPAAVAAAKANVKPVAKKDSDAALRAMGLL